jgi:hypothetical protein
MDENIQNWDTPIAWITHLANPTIHFFRGRLSITLENLDTGENWQLQVREAVGYKVTQHFGMRRLANTFVVKESLWISALHREPMLIPGQLDGVRHYLIETMSENIEILTKEEPSIFKTDTPR